MKIALAQLNYHIGNFDGNFRAMKKRVNQAREAGADLIVFGELSVCGYPPRDFLEFDDFIHRSRQIVDKMAELADGIGILIGAPSVNPVIEGKDLFNTAWLLEDGKISGQAHKTLLPTYDIFDEYRYFEPGNSFHTLAFRGLNLAVTICEDLWNVHNENPLYPICPMDELMQLPAEKLPDVMINLSASPFDYGHAAERIEVLRANCRLYKLPLIYVNHTGAQTEVLFDGGSLALSPHGDVFEELPYFEECLSIVDLDELRSFSTTSSLSDPQLPAREQPKNKYDLIRRGLVCGIRDYFGKLGFETAILGLSGGLDSAVTLALAAEALGPENVRSILMPSPFSSDHSIDDSVALCENLQSPYDIISIHSAYDVFLQQLNPLFEGRAFDLTEENLQARIRAVYLMALSNKLGYILLNTSNKSEAAVGYGTLYGDMCGGLSVIGDVYKTEVYELAKLINAGDEIIPVNIIDKPPSAELRHDQKDSDSLPDYDSLDPVLFHYIEERMGPREIIELGFDEKLVRRVLRLVNMSEYKRYQTPPMLRVSPKAFGMGRRLPIVGKYLS